MNHAVFRKIKSNPFLVIEKATFKFLNFHGFMSDLILATNDIMSFVKLKNRFNGFLKLMEDSN